MLKLLKLNNVGLRGLNSDIAPWDLPPEFITFGQNFRIESGAIKTFGGYKVIQTAPESFNPGFMQIASTLSGTFAVIPGRTRVYSFINDDFTSISTISTLNEGDEYLWSGCANGSVAFINNQFATAYYWNGSGSLAKLPFNIDGPTVTTWEDKGFTFDIIRQHKNFLFALNLHEAIDKPDAFRWSHPADENGIPFTWDEFNPEGIAGIRSLGGDGGAILDGLSLRDSFVIYSEKAINILTLSGDEFIWNRRELSSSIGILTNNCVVDVKGVHYFLVKGDIMTNDGNTIRSIAHDVITKRLNSRINTEFFRRSFVFRDDRHKEVWFCIPEDTSEYPNTAFIYNWRDNSWAIRELPVGTSYIVSTPLSSDVETWAEAVGTWDSRTDRWSEGQAVLTFSEFPIAINNIDSSVRIVDPDVLDEGSELETIIERTDFPLVDHRQVTSIMRVYPHVQGTELMRIQFGSQDRAGGPVRWKPYVIFDPSNDRKIDLRTTGELHAWRLSSIGTGTWRFSGMDIEYAEDGLR